MMNLATQTSVIGTYRDQPKTDTHGVSKWPVWLRILVIVCLSSALWTGIIAGVAANPLVLSPTRQCTKRRFCFP